MKFKKRQNCKGRNEISGCQKLGVFLTEIVYLLVVVVACLYQDVLNYTPRKDAHYCIYTDLS